MKTYWDAKLKEVEKDPSLYLASPVSKKKGQNFDALATPLPGPIISQTGLDSDFYASILNNELLPTARGRPHKPVSVHPVASSRALTYVGRSVKPDSDTGVINHSRGQDRFTREAGTNLRSGLVYLLQPYNYTDSSSITSNSYLGSNNRSFFSKSRKPSSLQQSSNSINLWNFFNKNVTARAYPSVSERTLSGSLSLSEVEASGRYSDAGISALGLN